MPRATPLVLLVLTAPLASSCGEGAPPAEAVTPVTASAGAEVEVVAPPHAREVTRLVEAALADETAWRWLEALCLDIGHRLSGSEPLERAVDWAVAELGAIDGVRAWKEPVTVPRWVRGEERFELVRPTREPLDALGLGMSVGTGPRGVTGDVVVVRSFEELDARAAEVRGKVVLFDVAMPPYDPETQETGYGQVAPFRTRGPARAAAHGARAVLLRSLTTDPESPPHTGATRYEEGGPAIPAAALTLPDADRIAAWVEAGERVTVRLRMDAALRGEATSHNVLAELPGRERPEEIVVFGGHLDSWDVGQGAHDDGSGVVTAMAALRLIRALDLRPRRTLRVVLWTNEENGLGGARAYAAAHGDAPHVAGIESDIGAAPVIGLQVQVDDAAAPAALRRMSDLAALLAPAGVRFAKRGHAGADLIPLAERGVPGVGLLHDPASYFDLHHTRADTIERVDPRALAQGTAVMAAVAWVLAEDLDPFGAGR